MNEKEELGYRRWTCGVGDDCCRVNCPRYLDRQRAVDVRVLELGRGVGECQYIAVTILPSPSRLDCMFV